VEEWHVHGIHGIGICENGGLESKVKDKEGGGRRKEEGGRWEGGRREVEERHVHGSDGFGICKSGGLESKRKEEGRREGGKGRRKEKGEKQEEEGGGRRWERGERRREQPFQERMSNFSNLKSESLLAHAVLEPP
jgi:hypothetical protein